MPRHPYIHDRMCRALILPSLVAGRSRMSASWNAAGLFVAALIGAGLVHLLAYHVPLDVPLGPRWIATARDLLVHCPLAGPLGAILAIAVLAPLLAVWEIGRLERITTRLAWLIAARPISIPRPPADKALPRSPWRLAFFVAVLVGLQVSALALANALCPMRMVMVMNGAPMTMMMAPALPLGLLHILVATGLGLLLWRVEHRLTRLRAQVAHRRRLLLRASSDEAPRLPDRDAARLPRWRYGHSLFARPPPRRGAA